MSARVLYAVSVIALIAGCAKSTEDAAQVLSPEFAASRGYDAYNSGNIPKAEAYFEIALEADPDNPYARVGLDEVRATLDDRARATRVVAASRATIEDTPDRFADITRERVAPRVMAAPVEVPVVEVAAAEAVAIDAVAMETVAIEAATVEAAVVETVAYEDADLAVPAYTGKINVETAPVPMAAISAVVPAGSEDEYQVVGSYESYMATLVSAEEPFYVASDLPAPMIETGVALAALQVEEADTIALASFDPVLTVETVAIPDPVALDHTDIATAYPVQGVLEYGQALDFAQSVPGGGQGLTIAASGPAGGVATYGVVLDAGAQPAATAGAQAIQPEFWAVPSATTNDSALLK